MKDFLEEVYFKNRIMTPGKQAQPYYNNLNIVASDNIKKKMENLVRQIILNTSCREFEHKTLTNALVCG